MLDAVAIVQADRMAGPGGRRQPRSFVVELVGGDVAPTAYARVAERARRTTPAFVRRVVSAPSLGLPPRGPVLPPAPRARRKRQLPSQRKQPPQPPQQKQLPLEKPQRAIAAVTVASSRRPQSAALPTRQHQQPERQAMLRRPRSAAVPSGSAGSLALDAQSMRATHAAASRPVAAQQRAKEYALEYENSKLSQLQPEPEPEPDVPQVNVLDDETMAELLFQEIDVDGSGTLDWGEIDALAKQLGQPLSEEELTAAMLEMDEDGNGTRSPLVFLWPRCDL